MKNITINLENATDAQLFWLEEMLEREIDDAEGTASNEQLWALGSDDWDNEFQHKENASENIEYAEMLKDTLKQLKDIQNYY